MYDGQVGIITYMTPVLRGHVWKLQIHVKNVGQIVDKYRFGILSTVVIIVKEKMHTRPIKGYTR